MQPPLAHNPQRESQCTPEEDEEEGEAGWNRYVHNEDERAVIRTGRDMH